MQLTLTHAESVPLFKEALKTIWIQVLKVVKAFNLIIC